MVMLDRFVIICKESYKYMIFKQLFVMLILIKIIFFLKMIF